MSRIDELLDELCPDGVPLRALGTVGEFIRGNGLQKKDLTESGFPAIHYGQIHTHYGTKATVTKSFTSPRVAAKLRLARPGDLLIATTSEDDAAVAKATAWLGKGEVALSGDAYIFRHSLDPTYVSYYFQSEMFQKQKRSQISGTKVRRVSGHSLARINIPEPPLTVQREVVRILDTFAELEAELKAELEAELEARALQYGRIRDHMMTFGADVPRVPLGKLGEFFRGKRFNKIDFLKDGIPAIHYGEIYTRYGVSAHEAETTLRPDLAGFLRYARTNDVVVVDVGETVADVGRCVAWLGVGDVAIHDHSFAFRHDQDAVFISQYFRTAEFQRAKAIHVASTKVKTLSIPGISRIAVPVPPIVTQRRIADALGSFDHLVSDLSINLPAELAARRKQYEYYRDRLLTFKELEA